MRHIAVISLFVLLPLFTIAQNTQERDLPFFDKLKVTNQINVFLTQAENNTARIVASGIDVNDVLTEITGKTLEITLKRGVYTDINVEVYITYRELRDINVSASGRASFQSVLKGDKVVLNATTNGQIDVDVNLRTVDAHADKGGSIRLGGNLGFYEARVSTAGVLTATDLQADSVFLTVRSRGIAKVVAKELLDADVRTGGILSLTGKPNNQNIKRGFGAIVNEE